ncbi:mediator of DNA damage checkpoint protein 1 isoform X2 [Centropristis striata]|nr:mediator of DNA damage checkpoint protein 1 isoform X2 [Centropristis striata]XP_059194666.1 mediator of DNA damage checkpoint protein 1 isoform X2 [Centropristis striata]
MEATQMISDSILESDEDENKEENQDKRGKPLAKLCILKNEHIPETELPLFLGDNVLGRDPDTCTVPLPAPSVSKQHATICLSVYRRRGSHSEVDMEALVWDQGSMNGTRKGRLKLTPKVRYALSEGDSLMVADIPCQYVSCTVSSQEDKRTPVGRRSGVKAQLPDAMVEKEGDTSVGSTKGVNGGGEATVSLLDQKDAKKTPVRSSCLSFEKTPTQPQGTLVPESDSDSSEERGDRRRRPLVSSSESYKSSPTCSTFLSPMNKIVPESEDESPITPSSSTKNRPHRHVSFSNEETDTDEGRQQLKKEKALVIVDNSEEEEEGEEERAALDGRESEESGQHVPENQKSNVSLSGEGELPVSTPAAFTDAIPAFNMDSDTDVEGEEEEVAYVGPMSLNTNQHTDQPPNKAQLHMDSDTDVDEDDDALDKVPKSVPSSADHTKPPHVISVLQPEGITMDSDTDVDDDDDDDDDAAVSDAATKAKPTSLQCTPTTDSAPSTQLKDFHLDSDTDVDEEEEKIRGTNETCCKTDETATRLDIKQIGPESAAAAPHSLHLESDTDDEDVPAPAISEPAELSSVTESCTAAVAGADLDILSDSDTDVEDDSPLVIPVAVASLSDCSGTVSEARKSDSDADTDVDEPSVPPAGDRVNPAELEMDSDTDVEDNGDFGETGEGQIPGLCRENTPGLLVSLQPNCSTPVQVSEEAVENMDTQAFLSPSSVPFRLPQAIGPIALSSCSDSQEDEDFVVAETQSFIIQARDDKGKAPEDHSMEPTQAFGINSSGDEKAEQSSRGGSFQLGLSDSSHLQDQARALATESTQAFVSDVEGVNLEDTEAYAAISNADRTSLENDSNLEATQAYGEGARCLVMSPKEGQVDLALEATQAYISEPYSDSDDETDEDERKNTAVAETQPFNVPTSSSLAMAETQPMCAFEEEEEESLDEENPVSSVQQVKPKSQNETEEKIENEEAAQPQNKHLGQALSVAETQPMHISDDEESDDEAFIPGTKKSEAKPLQLEDEQAQTLTNSELSLVETQPMHSAVAETQPMATSGNEDSDVEDSIPGPRKRKAKQLRLEDERSQTLTNSELSAAATQPMDAGEDEQSDEEDSIPVIRKRRAKPLPLEESQPLTNSEVCADRESDEEDSIPGPRKRRAKPLQLEESQPLTSSEVCEERDSEDEDSIPGPRRRKAKSLKLPEEDTQPLTNSEASTVETLPLETKTGVQPQKGKGRQSEAGTSGTTTRGTRARLREEEEQAECPQPPKRQTRGMNKALPTTRGRRGKSRPSEEESEEEEEVEQPKRARGKKSMRQQNENEKERLETERNKQAEHNKLERERKEKERQENLQAENAERLRIEQEIAEKKRIEKETKEQEEQKRAERAQKEKEEQLERERKEKEEKERLEHDNAEREEKERLEREEMERIEKERKEQEEKERLEREKAEREQKERLELEEVKRIEKERREKEEKERLEREKTEREEKERLEREEIERIEQAKREIEERLEKEKKEQEHEARLEREAKEREEREKAEKEEKEAKEKQIKEQQENKTKTPARGRRAAKRTVASSSTTELEQDSTVAANEDVPARRTRSRSNSSNSVSSERSASSVNTRGRGRGRGARRTSEPPQAASTRSSNRRRTVAAGSTEQNTNDISPQGVLSRSSSTNSLNSDTSSHSLSSQSRGRGGRQRGRGRKTEAEPISFPPGNSQSDQTLAPKSTTRGRKSRKVEESSNEVPHEEEKEKAGPQQASTTRGRRRANANDSEPAAADKEGPTNKEEGCTSEESPLAKKSVRTRGQKAEKSEIVDAPVAPAVSDGDEAKEKRKGRKREFEANAEEDSSSSSKISKGKEKAQKTEAAEEEAKAETKDDAPVQAKRRGQAKKNAKDSPTELEVKEESEKMEEGTADRRGRGRQPVVQKKKKEQQEESGASSEDPREEASEPQTPTSSVSRKRQAPVDASPVAKTPRSSSASPAASGRLRAVNRAFKVLFTGVVDEQGERVLARLGGSMAKGVADMNCLVTDKVRRTVKFLCAVAKGVPIVTTHWLEKSGIAGSFLPPNLFLVKDPEQEKKFNFCLQESLRIASSQRLLQGYEIHVTKSVKPEPPQMKDIISCSGAAFLPKMPSSHKSQTVVISCEEDWSLCGPALSASLPVVTAEFILTGILQQKLDLQTHTLSAPTHTVQPAGGRGRSRKKT